MGDEISQEHLKNVCKLGQREATCAFLMMAPGFACAKGTPIESVIRDRLADGSMKAKGDNCPGWKVVSNANQ